MGEEEEGPAKEGLHETHEEKRNMEITFEQARQITDNLSDVRVDPTYSGRGMFDATCLAFTGYVNQVALGAAMVEALGDEAWNIVSRVQQNSFGRGVVVYFPGVEVIGDFDYCRYEAEEVETAEECGCEVSGCAEFARIQAANVT